MFICILNVTSNRFRCLIPDTSVKSTLNKIYKIMYKTQLKFKDSVTSLQKL